MKKLLPALLFITIIIIPAVALDFEFSGEVKTGFYAEQTKNQAGTTSQSKIHNNDGDSGDTEGRIRLNFNVTHENIGMNVRYKQDVFRADTPFRLEFAYAYGYLFDRQFKASLGRLGESPWGTSGATGLNFDVEDQMWVDVDDEMGIRFEFMPKIIPGLNFGFVVNAKNEKGDRPASVRPVRFFDPLMESVLGISYEHDYFAVRFSYRLDTEYDHAFNGNGGAEFVYRIEERILRQLIPGFMMWANGYYYGIGQTGEEPTAFENWLYIYYNNDYIRANLNIRHYENKHKDATGYTLLFKPGFMYKLFDNLLNIGIGFGLEMGDGHMKKSKDSLYNYWFVEPKIRLNINSNAYAALVYNYTHQYTTNIDTSNTNWLNIRVGYSF